MRRTLTQTQSIALGFFCMIVIGTLLLMCPFSSRTGIAVSPLDALFTAASASCVTGFVVCDTYTQWSLFGQLVILVLVQIGGLGFMTIATLFSFLLRRKISLRQRGILQESMNSNQIGGMVRLVWLVLKGTLLFEGVGAVLLSIRFVPMLGFGTGIYYGIFHAVSAFCNAGFDLMGRFSPYSSMVQFRDDWFVNLVLIVLMVMGGIGFLVWKDVCTWKWHWKQYTLNTKIVLTVSGILLFGGAALFALLEWNGVFADQPAGKKVLSALFASAAVRTAGFSTVDLAGFSDSSRLLHFFLMFIGGSPGSTTGGIKTTTLAVLFLGVLASIQHKEDMNVFHRRLEDDAVKRASAITVINLGLALSAGMLICSVEHVPMMDALLESFSAISTAGMSIGITRNLHVVSQVVLIFMMFCGRVGSLSFALSFAERKRQAPVRQPEEKISIG